MHFPTKLKYSPLSHSLSSRKKSNSIESSLNLSLNKAFSGNFSSIPLVKNANLYLYPGAPENMRLLTSETPPYTVNYVVPSKTGVYLLVYSSLAK